MYEKSLQKMQFLNFLHDHVNFLTLRPEYFFFLVDLIVSKDTTTRINFFSAR